MIIEKKGYFQIAIFLISRSNSDNDWSWNKNRDRKKRDFNLFIFVIFDYSKTISNFSNLKYWKGKGKSWKMEDGRRKSYSLKSLTKSGYTASLLSLAKRMDVEWDFCQSNREPNFSLSQLKWSWNLKSSSDISSPETGISPFSKKIRLVFATTSDVFADI